MHNYNHKKLLERITKLDILPSEKNKYSEWIKAEEHLDFLRENSLSDELIVLANSEYTYMDSIVVPNEVLERISPSQLALWSFNSSNTIASYVYGGGKDNLWIERGVTLGYDGNEVGTQLVFNRTFDGWVGLGGRYIEVNQEYTHITGIHWRPEKKAYCRYDGRGDLESIVSVTTRDDKDSQMTLVTFKWDALEEYLSAANATLLRRFDFTLLRRGEFNGWPQESPETFEESGELFYHRLVVPGYAAYTAGKQLIHPRRPNESIHKGIKDSWSGDKEKKYAEFVAFDWRNQSVTSISAAPGASTNYFEAKNNALPFELSPVFFRAEVLSKYKTDRDKYTIGERHVMCRNAWHLKGIDVNEAGQVHAYICDLRRLPYEEQLHWLSYNEQPKASISKRALVNDFHGEFVDFSEPPSQVLSLIHDWHEKKFRWWVLRDEKLMDRVNTPLTSSRDEWAEAFMDLAKLIVEGFEAGTIREKLDEEGILYSKDERTIVLLEKLLNKNIPAKDVKKLRGFAQFKTCVQK